MSCTKCGNLFTPHHNNSLLFFSLAVIAFVFGVALLTLPFELFFIIAVVELVALNYIEKQMRLFEGKEYRCPNCGYTKNTIYQPIL